MAYPTNIFLADDDIDDIDFFKMALNEITPHSQLTVASDGYEMVDILRKTNGLPEIIFLDINMPKMNGIDALTYIRTEIAGGTNLPVIVYSTTNDEHYIRKAFEAGANCFFTKPRNFTELKACICNLLSADWAKIALPYDEFAVVV